MDMNPRLFIAFISSMPLIMSFLHRLRRKGGEVFHWSDIGEVTTLCVRTKSVEVHSAAMDLCCLFLRHFIEEIRPFRLNHEM